MDDDVLVDVIHCLIEESPGSGDFRILRAATVIGIPSWFLRDLLAGGI